MRDEHVQGAKQGGKPAEISSGDDRRGMSGSGDVSLTIFITSISDSKSLTSFAYCFFHFSGPPGLRLAFDTAERNGKFDRTQFQRREQRQRKDKVRSILL